MRERIVFDTTTVVSAVLFRNGRLNWLRSHWRDGECTPLISKATAEELMRVLRGRKFNLPTDLYNEALAAYLPHCASVAVVEASGFVCRDVNDQPFLDLAMSGGAQSLVSGDQDLLVLSGQTPFLIESPRSYQERILTK